MEIKSPNLTGPEINPRFYFFSFRYGLKFLSLQQIFFLRKSPVSFCANQFSLGHQYLWHIDVSLDLSLSHRWGLQIIEPFQESRSVLLSSSEKVLLEGEKKENRDEKRKKEKGEKDRRKEKKKEKMKKEERKRERVPLPLLTCFSCVFRGAE